MTARTPKKSTRAKKATARKPVSKKPTRTAAKSSTGKSSKATRAPARKTTKTATKTTARRTGGAATKRAPRATQGAAARKPALLSGGNPQIPKGEGDAPVQAYIKAIPDRWKQDIARRIDAIVERAVPDVQKAVKWNSPFYGLDGKTWFLSLHCFTRYVKVTFFRGTSLRPVPPGESKTKETRYLDVPEEGFDEKQFADWVEQASRLPGEKM